MLPSEMLKAARAKIEQPEAWAQGYFAYRPVTAEVWRKHILHHGRALEGCGVSDQAAVCWCVRGAVGSIPGFGVVDASGYLPPALREVTKASHKMEIGLAHVARFNDAPHRRHNEVLNLLDVAIRLAENDEQADDHPDAHL